MYMIYGLFFILIIMIESGKYDVFIIVFFVLCLCFFIIWLLVIIIKMLYDLFCLMIFIVLLMIGVNEVGLFRDIWLIILVYCFKILYSFWYGVLFLLKLNMLWFLVMELLNLNVGISLFLLNGLSVLVIICIICW